MAKTVQKKKTEPAKKSKPPLIQEKYQNLVFISAIVIAVFVFFMGAIFGGGFTDFDNVSSLSFQNYIKEAAKTGNFPLWIPYIFGGMPSFSALLTTGDRIWDIIPQIIFGFFEIIGKIFNNDVARMSCFYSVYGIGIYLLMISKDHTKFVAFFTAIAAIFSTWVITWVMIGHNTKPVVFATFPYIFLLMEKLRAKFSVLWAFLLIVTLHIMIEGGHLQMIFYGAVAVAVYLIFELVSRLITKKEPLSVVRAAVLLVACGAVAFMMSSDRYLSTLEYTPYSTRGSAPIHKTEKQHQDATGGHDYEYATMWSYSTQELVTLFVPSYYGFGLREVKLSVLGDEPQMISTYWGQKESEDSPPYMGILIISLAIIGFIYYRKDVFVQTMLVISLFAVFLSFGKNLPWLYDLFYYWIPSFNKFRAPSMALAIMHFAVPILAGYGLTAVLTWRKNLTEADKKRLNLILILASAFMVLGFLFSALFKTSYMDSVSNTLNARYKQTLPAEFFDVIWNNTMEDWYINGVILIASALSLYFYARQKLSKSMFLGILLVLLIFDLWRVDYRRMDVSKEKASVAVFGQKQDIFDFIKQDKSTYRIADFASNPANLSAYFLVENINGYHAAKLRVYQDLMDVANNEQFLGSTSQLFNPFLWNLMNVKYVITTREFGAGTQPLYVSPRTREMVYMNPTLLERAFFVKTAVKAKQIDILNHLKAGDFNPLDTVFLEVDLPQQIDAPDSTASVKLTNKENEYLKFDVTASSNNLLFISEIYYPPGWKAYIDGKETTIYKANYAFRAVMVPQGKHKLEFKFTSKNFELGRALSIAGTIFTVLGLAFGVFIQYNKKRKSDE